ncbi:MAG: cytochrome P450 [Opitutaceae bacterium]|nr:cytochrome P450 [Opitutaceae bacterium]
MLLDHAIGSPAFREDPFPFYRELQERDPVQRSQVWNCWVVTRYDAVRDCLQDAKRFSNLGRVTGLFHRHFSAEQLATLRPLVEHYSHGLINVDPPDHTRIRRLLHEVFRPSTIARLADRVRAFVDRRLAARLPAGRLEVVHDLAHPLPVQVIAELFGLAQVDVPRFAAWSASIVEFMQTPQPDYAACLRSQQALLDLRAHLRAAIADRRQKPRDDVLSLMVAASVDGDRLTEEEILGTSVTILLGGHETTTRLLATSIYELIRHPEQQERLRADPALIDTAVEECLRYCGPFHRDQRVVAVDTVVDGRAVARGDFILLLLAAANRDPRQFPDPDSFDLGRRPNRHLAFGFGPHICLGAHLARLEMSVALRTLLASCRRLRLEGGPVHWEFGFLRGPAQLPIVCDR